MKEIIIAVDIEADGPIPAVNSMLSLGAAAYKIEGKEYKLLSTFSMNLVELPGATQDARTMKWWEENKKAWEASRKNPEKPQIVMEEFNKWVQNHGPDVAFAAWPATFDFMWVYWYLMRFVGSSPFAYSGIDVKSYALAVMKEGSWIDFWGENLPKEWIPKDNPLEHVAVNDAVWEGERACRIIIANAQN